MIGLIFACLMAIENNTNNEDKDAYLDFQECEYCIDAYGNYIDGTSVAIEDDSYVQEENNVEENEQLTEFKKCETCGGLIDEETGKHIGCGGLPVEHINH